MKLSAIEQNKRDGAERRERFIAAVTETGSVATATDMIGVAPETVEKWKQRWPDFATSIGRAIAAHSAASTTTASAGDPVRLENGDPLPFAQFRKRFLGLPVTPWFQSDVVEQMESAPAGSVILVLLHPESGKTQTVEDWVAWKFAYDKSVRILFGTSDDKKAEKRVQRVQRMLDDGSPHRELIQQFGPFKPDKTTDEGYQPWTKGFFNLRGKQEASDTVERDYSLEAVGILSAIQGNRCDWLILDDVQSLANLSATEKIIEKIRQDWLSRPGSKGKTVFIGTRVGPNDVYERMQEEGLVDYVINYPAVLEGYELWPVPKDKTDEYLPPAGVKFLWPERYSPREYLIMRKNAGEIGWERNYMQRGADSKSAPFSDELFTKALDPIRSVNAGPATIRAMNPSMQKIAVTLDPGFGVNACMAIGFDPDHMWVLDGRLDRNLSTNGQIAQVCREMILKWTGSGMDVGWLVIEDKAFQRGLLKDDDFKRLVVDFGLSIVPYTTGSEKNDPNIGVPSMSAAMDMGVIVFPGADDPATQEFLKYARSQFVKWRPNIKGNRLTQDYVMTTWFGFLRWRKLRASLNELGANPNRAVDLSAFTTAGLPYTPTRVLTLSGQLV